MVALTTLTLRVNFKGGLCKFQLLQNTRGGVKLVDLEVRKDFKEMWYKYTRSMQYYSLYLLPFVSQSGD